jgi:hypothetical protein
VGSVNNLRRYYLLKRLFARMREEDSESIWQGKQESVAGTELPPDFPHRGQLVVAGYSTREDLDGADADELLEHADLSQREADAVLAAAAQL